MSDTTIAGAAETLFDALASDPEFGEEPVEAPDEQPSEPEEEDGAAEEEESDEADESEGEESDDETEESDDTAESSEESDGTAAKLERDLKADYTRKTQALAEERRKVDAEVASYREMREAFGEKLRALDEFLTRTKPSEPDWDALRKENPAEFAAQWAEHQRREQDLAALRAEQARLAEDRDAEQRQAIAAHLAAEKSRLLEAIPEWADEAKAAPEKKALMDYARGMGFTDEDLSNVYDHRLILLLRKAARHDEMLAKGKAQIEEKKAPPPKVLKPGSRDTAPKSGKNVKAKIAFDRLRKSGRATDAAAYIESIMPDDF